MKTKLIKYTLLIEYSDKSEEIEIETNDLKKTMEQYSRNREFFNWKILKKIEN